MPKLISCSLTEQAVVERRKTQTRRLGWWKDKRGRQLVKVGDELVLCRKVMGRRRADGTVEPLVRLGRVRVVEVRREALCLITDEDIVAEGVDPALIAAMTGGDIEVETGQPTPPAWVEWFCEEQGCDPYDDVTVISWEYLA